MATSRRDVELGIAVETAGVDEIKKLGDSVRALAQEGSEAAPAFIRLADEIDKIASDVGAISTLAELRSEVEKLGASQVEAAGRSDKLTIQYRELEAAAKSAAAATAAAKVSEQGAKQVYDDKRLALKLLKLETDSAAKSTDVYKASISALKIEVAQAEAAYRRTQAATKQAADVSLAAVAAQKDLTAAYKDSQKALEQANSALGKRSVDLKAVEAAAEAAGTASVNLGEAEQRLRKDLLATSTAAQNLQKTVVSLAAAQKEFTAQESFDKVLADSTKLDAAGANVNAFTADLAKAEQAERDLIAQSKIAASALDAAFRSTGVRSISNIKAEIDKVNAALLELSRDARVSGAEFDRAFASGQNKIKALNAEISKTPAEIEKAGAATTFLKNSLAQLAAIYGGIELGTKFFEATAQIETLRRTLTLITGSSETAAQQIEFLRTTADRTGQSFAQLGQDFSTFTAATVKSGMALEDSNKLFQTVTNAAGQLGLSTQRTGLIITALSQIASKGKVSLEELQGQLGESLPGALAVTAKGLGITTSELTKLIENGKLAASDFFPGFRKGLEDTFGAGNTAKVQTLAAAFNRVKNALTELSQKAVDTAPYKALVVALDALAGNASTVASGVYSMGKAFLAFKAIGIVQEFFGIQKAAKATAAATVLTTEASVVQAAVTQKSTVAIGLETAAINANTIAKRGNTAATGILTATTAAVSTAYAKTTGAVAGAVGSIKNFVGLLGGPYVAALTLAIGFSEQLGNGIAYVAAKMSGAIDTINRNEAALKTLAAAEKEAAAQALERAKLTTQSVIQVQVAYQKEEEAAKVRLVVAEKGVKAAKEQGEAAARLAALTGDQTKIVQAATAAADANAVATYKVLTAQKEEVEVLERERAALALAAGAQETWTDARRAFFLDLDQQLEKKRAELELTKQEAAASLAASDAASVAAQTYKDNATKIEAFKKEVDDATKAYARLLKGLQDGTATQKQVEAGARRLAIAQGLLKDAFNDASDAIERRRAVLQENAAQEQQSLTLLRAQASANERVSNATGQYNDKLKAAVDLKKADVQESRNRISLTEREVALMREEVGLLQQQLDKNDPLYEQKKRQIDTILAAIKAKTSEGLIERENLRALNAELGKVEGSLRKAGDAFVFIGQSADSARNSMGTFTAEAKRAIDATKSFSVLQEQTYNADKFATNKDGSTFSVGGQLNIPDGMYFDSVAANKDPRFQLGQIDGSQFMKPKVTPTLGGAGYPANFGAPGSGYQPGWLEAMNANSSGKAGSSKTVNVNLKIGSGAAIPLIGSQDAVDKLLQGLEDAQRNGGYGTGP